MRPVTVQMFSTLDGVVQAPGDPEEDRSGEFAHGGWHLPFFESQSQAWVVRANEEASAYLFGRRTYDFFARYWPTATEDEAGPLPALMNSRPKYVVSTSLREPLDWAGSHLLVDAESSLDEVRQDGDGSLLVIGSAALSRSLLASDRTRRDTSGLATAHLHSHPLINPV